MNLSLSTVQVCNILPEKEKLKEAAESSVAGTKFKHIM
jgi:hypothetical protein